MRTFQLPAQLITRVLKRTSLASRGELLSQQRSVARIFRILSFSAISALSGSVATALAQSKPPIPDRETLTPAMETVADLGEHWSGLDRVALYKELVEGDIQAAMKRIVSAAEGSDRDHAEYHIIAELISTDLLREHRLALKQICQTRLEAAEREKPRGLDEEKWRDRLLARSTLYEEVLHDREKAAQGYKEILRMKLGPGKKASDLDGSTDVDLTPAERAAARKLARFEERSSQR